MENVCLFLVVGSVETVRVLCCVPSIDADAEGVHAHGGPDW